MQRKNMDLRENVIVLEELKYKMTYLHRVENKMFLFISYLIVGKEIWGWWGDEIYVNLGLTRTCGNILSTHL